LHEMQRETHRRKDNGCTRDIWVSKDRPFNLSYLPLNDFFDGIYVKGWQYLQ
jgi:hypothetical protein